MAGIPKLKYRNWTQEEDSFLEKHYEKKGRDYCAEKLERTPDAVDTRIRRHLPHITLHSKTYRKALNKEERQKKIALLGRNYYFQEIKKAPLAQRLNWKES